MTSFIYTLDVISMQKREKGVGGGEVDTYYVTCDSKVGSFVMCKIPDNLIKQL